MEQWYRSRSYSRTVERKLVDVTNDNSLCVIFIAPNQGVDELNSSMESFASIKGLESSLTCKLIVPESAKYSLDHLQHFSISRCSQSDVPATLNHLISNEIESDWVVVLKTPAKILGLEILTLLAELAHAPDQISAVFGDELIENRNQISSGFFRPAFNLDMFLSFPSEMSRHWIFRRKHLISAGGVDEGVGDVLEFEWILKIVEENGIGSIGRVDQPFFSVQSHRERESLAPYSEAVKRHLQRRGYENALIAEAQTAGTLKVQYGHTTCPLVSIIISTRDELSLLRTCVESILEKTAYQNYELLILDYCSETTETLTWLRGLEEMAVPNIRVLRCSQSVNVSANKNYGIQMAKGDYALLLDSGLGIIRPEWLDELMNHAQRPEVGVVGAKVLTVDGKIEHSGIVLGMRGPAEGVYSGEALDDLGYMNRLIVDQNCSAVSGSCMLIRKSVYEQVGGLDEEVFAVSYNHVDLCLRVAQAGYLTVWTPRSIVMQVAKENSDPFNNAVDDEKSADGRAEKEAMYERWLPSMGDDPAFNRNLSLRARGFEVEHRVELNWQPQKLLNLPTVLVHPADQWGCGHYRIIQPLESMKAQGVSGGMIAAEFLTVPEMARLDADSFVYQRQLTDGAVENMQHARRFLNKPVVYELDDYLPNLPLKSAYRKHMPKDVLKSLRRSLKHVDRFIVSTHPLAEAFEGLHPDIRVVENRLPVDWWKDLSASKRESVKPRVGWAGGMGHTGDLELVEAVVSDLADEVDWVFFGMCPDKLRPYVKEVHEGVDIALYPQKLASLNLDLAIAPLEDNFFNRCKSNLRLLEYGACGFPVVCSDVEPYREHDLPVTRVKNRYKDWLDAIRMHLSDLDEAARAGEELRKVVRRDWMLEGQNLQKWLDAWTKF
ncbi:O-antigen biosynthesis protein [Marinobacter similis]|uniref:O-antigen biosynthesis protein n=1 Tax=Marinobacter similis TaxID=1420916 RepID=W5YJ90_9GAMM|nr:O-antigen biosynthesis protein [Marinobacter similis]